MTGHLWVIGDSWTDPARGGSGWRVGWPSLVAARLGLGLVDSGAGGQGYSPETGSLCFPVQVARGSGVGAAAVIVWGSVNDRSYDPAGVRAAAEETYRMIRRGCPGAPLLIYGPQWWHTTPAPELAATTAAVAAAAAAAGAVFVDPHDWMQGRPDLMDDSGNHPNAAGHLLIADRVELDLLFALAPHSDLWHDYGDEGGWVQPCTIGVPMGAAPPELVDVPQD